ncbi:DUF4126 domain-containing protein, partial [bacterium]|nr:DUF4126 domain-containing protein [bacterium]
METALSLMLGLGLAAAVGFRIFVPFLMVSLAAHTGHLDLSDGQAWIGTLPALIMFAAATLAEIAAYHLPWFDHLLDILSGPAAVVCGAILMASAAVDMEPLVKWPVAIIAGGGTAGLIRGASAGLRVGSTALTGGFANPGFTAVETGGSLTLTLLALLVPVAALVLTALLLI